MIVGIGTDLVELDRFRLTLDRTPGIVGRVFTVAEADYCRARRDPTERFAGRFAAKEAVLKALGTGLFSFPLTDIEVARDDDSGAPSLRLHDRAAARADELGVVDWRLTITHTDRTAQAIALALARPDAPSLRVRLGAIDPDRTVAFYEQVLGFVVTAEPVAGTRLRLGTVVLDVERADGSPPAAERFELVIEVPDLAVATAKAQAAGATVPEPVRVDGFVVVDPDGVRIRVTAPSVGQ